MYGQAASEAGTQEALNSLKASLPNQKTEQTLPTLHSEEGRALEQKSIDPSSGMKPIGSDSPGSTLIEVRDFRSDRASNSPKRR